VEQKGIQYTFDLICYDHQKGLERKIKWLKRVIKILIIALPLIFYVLGYYINITEVNRQHRVIQDLKATTTPIKKINKELERKEHPELFEKKERKK